MLKKFICILILFFTFINIVNAGALEDALNEFKNLLYFIAAGVAALILVIHGIRLKLASSPTEREEAKKGIIFVILGLVLIILAVMIVSLIYRTPPQPYHPTITTIYTTTHYFITTTAHATITSIVGTTTTYYGITTTSKSTIITTTSTTTTTTSTTTTTLPYLTAKNLVDCINSKNGALYAEFNSCPACRAQRRVFTEETSPPVGPGAPEFSRLNILSPWSTPCGYIPCWSYGSKNQAGCKTMPQLNSFFGCNLIPYPGHSYIPCM